MSTRAMYTFKDEHTTVHVYKHSDGYPEGPGALSAIASACDYAWPLPRFEADEFAAAFVAATKRKGTAKWRGGNLRLCGTHVQQPYDFSTDSEYWYVITCPDANLFGKKSAQLMIDIYEANWWDDEKTSDLIFSGSLDDAIKKYEVQLQELDNGTP